MKIKEYKRIMNQAHDLSVEIKDITAICDDAARGKLTDIDFKLTANIQQERTISIDEDGDLVDSSSADKKRIVQAFLTPGGIVMGSENPIHMHCGNTSKKSKDRQFKCQMSEEECLIFFSIILERKKKDSRN